MMDPRRMDAVVDLETSETREATGAGRSVGPEVDCGFGIISALAEGGSSSKDDMAIRGVA